MMNPYERFSLDDALSQPFFESVRKEVRQGGASGGGASGGTGGLDPEAPPLSRVSMDDIEEVVMSKAALRTKMFTEIYDYHQQRSQKAGRSPEKPGSGSPTAVPPPATDSPSTRKRAGTVLFDSIDNMMAPHREHDETGDLPSGHPMLTHTTTATASQLDVPRPMDSDGADPKAVAAAYQILCRLQEKSLSEGSRGGGGCVTFPMPTSATPSPPGGPVSLPVLRHADRIPSGDRGCTASFLEGVRRFYDTCGGTDSVMEQVCKEPGSPTSVCTLTMCTGLSLMESCVYVAEQEGIDVKGLFGRATTLFSYSWTGTKLVDMLDAIEDTRKMEARRRGGEKGAAVFWIDMFCASQNLLAGRYKDPNVTRSNDPVG